MESTFMYSDVKYQYCESQTKGLNSVEQWFSNFPALKLPSIRITWRVLNRLLGPNPRVSDSASPGWDLRVCTSNKCKEPHFKNLYFIGFSAPKKKVEPVFILRHL